MFIDLHPIYECNNTDCKAIVDENDIKITKTDEVHIRHCPVCGCETLTLFKLEED